MHALCQGSRGGDMSDRRDHRDTDHKARDLARQFFRDYPVLDTSPKQADDTSTEPRSNKP